MNRRLTVAALLLLLAVACKTSTGTPPTSSTGDDSGPSSCPCVVKTDGGVSYTIPCGVIGCAGTIEYLCEDGVPALQGPCVPPTSDVCVPSCRPGQCKTDDGCGGVCTCPAGESCVFTQCSSNGCLLGLGEYCGLNPEAGAGNCCASGYKCPTMNLEGGSPACCALTNEGACTSDGDCCDAPAVRCTTLFSDAGATLGRRCL